MASKPHKPDPDTASERPGLLRALLPEHDAVRRLVRRFVRISSDADDIVQDAYLKLLERPMEAREDKAAMGYLFVVARNLAADAGRRSAREQRRAAALNALTTQLGNVEPGVEELVFVEQAGERLKHALRELPDRTRQVFLLHRIEGHSHQEIAHLLAVTTRTVERDVAAALQHLKQALFSGKSLL